MFALNQFPSLTAGGPDVCATNNGVSDQNIPYSNSGVESLGAPFPPNFLVGGAPVHNMGTVIGTTTDDLPGYAGVASGTVMGPSFSFVNSNTCLMGGLPTKRVTSCGVSNTINTPSMASTPNQLCVLVLSP
jgi:hypothetical protein